MASLLAFYLSSLLIQVDLTTLKQAIALVHYGTLGTSASKYFDSTCCNYTIPNPYLFHSQVFATNVPISHIIDNSHIYVIHTNHISTSHLSIPNTF